VTKFAETLKMNRKFAEWTYNAIVKQCYINIIEGVVRVGKDFISTIAFIERIMSYTGTAKQFLIAAVNIKQAYLIIGDYILNYLDKAAKRCKLGVADAIRLKTPYGDRYIVFAGGKNNNSDREIQGLTLGGVYATEINLLNKGFIDEIFKRIAESGRDGFVFGTLNPLNEEHYFYTDFLNIWQQEEAVKQDNYLNYMHVTLEDGPNMTPEKIYYLKRGKNPDSIEYKRDILGLRVSAEGAIYEINDEHILQEYNPQDYIRIITVADPGSAGSATGFIVAGLTFNNDTKQIEMHVLKEYYHRNASNNEIKKKDIIEYANDYVSFIFEAAEIFKKYPERIYIDTDRPFYDLVVKRLRAEGKANNISFPLKTGAIGEIDARIKQGISLLFQKRLRFHKDCKRSIEMFKAAQYDPKSYQQEGKLIRLDDPKNNQSVDMIDCTEYAFNHFLKELTK
jgi:PBSX family phage terminase large subunit